jgi:hypothetical protein
LKFYDLGLKFYFGGSVVVADSTEVKAISGNVEKLLGGDEQVPMLAGIFCPYVSAQSDRP